MQSATEALPERGDLSDQDRAEILTFASWLLPIPDRTDPEVVTGVAAPLLSWAARATSKEDRRARMAAMRREHDNSSPKVTYRRDPQEFLWRAGVYYRFITGGES